MTLFDTTYLGYLKLAIIRPSLLCNLLKNFLHHSITPSRRHLYQAILSL